MTFTYDLTLATDLAKVRFELGDTDSNGYYLSDEEITAKLASEGGIGGAVVACIQFIIRKLSAPDFRADWLQVSNAAARMAWEQELKRARRAYGAAAIPSAATHVYRADSQQTEAPDYTSGTDAADDALW